MEQAVWFYVGIVVALVGLGMLVSVVLMGTDVTKGQLAGNAANSLALQCSTVCNSDIGTALGIKAEIGSGSVISASGNAICITYGGEKECRRCSCETFDYNGQPFRLDLSTDEAMAMFDTHVYNCTFERDVNGVILRCRG